MLSASPQIKVAITGDASKFTAAVNQTNRAADSLGSRMQAMGSTITRRVTLPLAGAAVGLVHLANQQETAERKMESTFQSMGAAAWTNTEAIKANASALQEQTTFGDETILGLQDLLLTFGKVTNQVGEGNDVFDRATELGLDMSAALGQDLKSSAVQLGKALNDPIKGVTALQRVGVSFTAQQREQINVLVESGQTLEAQKIILEELEKQFGGTAEAIADTAEGKLKQAMNTLGDLGETVGAPMAAMAADIIPKFVAGIEQVASFAQALPGPLKVAAVAAGGLGLALAAVAANPVVLGLGLIAGAVGLIGSKAQAHLAEVEAFKDEIIELSEAGESATSLVADFLSPGDIREFREAGVTMSDLALAIELAREDSDAGAVAFAELSDRIENANKWAFAGGVVVNQLAGKLDVMQQAARDAGIEQHGLTGEVVDFRDAVARAMGIVIQARDRERPWTPERRGLADATQAAADAELALAEARDTQVSELGRLNDASERVRAARSNLVNVNADVTSSEKDRADAAWEVVEAESAAAVTAESFNEHTGPSLTQTFINIGREAGLAADDLWAFVNAQLAAINAGSPSGGGGGITTVPIGVTPVPNAFGGITKATPGGTVSRLGEAGSDEAVIPLNDQGAQFMQDALGVGGGGGGSGTIVVPITIGSTLIEELIIDTQRRAVRRGRV